MLSTLKTEGRAASAFVFSRTSPRDRARTSPKVLESPEPARSFFSQMTDSTPGDWSRSMFRSNFTFPAPQRETAKPSVPKPRRARTRGRVSFRNGSSGVEIPPENRGRSGLSKSRTMAGRRKRVIRTMTARPKEQMTPNSTRPLKPVRTRGKKEKAAVSPARSTPGPSLSIISPCACRGEAKPLCSISRYRANQWTP